VGAVSDPKQSPQDQQALEVKQQKEGQDNPAKPAPISVSLSLAGALRAHNKGNLEKAVQIYSGILRKYPDHADANYLLGVAAFERGLQDDAIAMIQKALEADPDNASYYGKLGEIYTSLNMMGEANHAYDKAAALAPHDVRFSMGRAQIMERNGDITAALALYETIMARFEDAAEPRYRAAVLLARQGARDKARDYLEQALKLRPSYADAHFLLGLLHMGAGKVTEAKHHLDAASVHSEERADHHMKVAAKLLQLHDVDKALNALRREIKVVPNNDNAYRLMGSCLMSKGQTDGALVSFDRAIALNPQAAMAYAERAVAYQSLRRMDEALSSVEGAVSILPDDPNCLWTYAHILRLMDRCDDSLDILAKILRVHAGHHKSLLETAYAYKDKQQLDNALYYAKEAQVLDENNPHIRTLIGEILLQADNWQTGWAAYEARVDHYPIMSDVSAHPLWDGVQGDGRQLLVHVDGCYSDALQFARFLKMAKDRVAGLYVIAPKSLVRLFNGISEVDAVIVQGQSLPYVDAWCRLGSLPHILGMQHLDHLPAFRPYLSAQASEKAVWAERVKPISGQKKVGLVWQGDETWGDDMRRSPGIWPFSRLFYMRGIDFIGLQVGTANNVLMDPQLSKMVQNLGIEILDFADTAAIIDGLDLVITCDSAVAHLAGAMGKAVWMMLPFAHDWRWGVIEATAGVATTPWYPSMTLYQQTVGGEWADVFARIGQDLDRFSRQR